jgi:phosphatidate cytidylyltransferase
MAEGGAKKLENTDAILGLSRNLALRILSSLVILPLVSLFLALGGLYFAGLVALIAGCMAWEWGRISAGEGARVTTAFAAAGSAAVVALAVLAEPELVGYALAALLVLLLLTFMVLRKPGGIWTVSGCVVACVPCFATLWLRADEDPSGLSLLIWLIGSVVATDIGAYIAGRSIGGPRLAPSISPNKTWAGLVGGMVASGGGGWLCGTLIDGADPIVLAIVGAFLAIIAQIGDLLESLFKRRFSVKDSGALIPGHGGVLDRLDGHMTVITVVAILVLVSGQTPLMW